MQQTRLFFRIFMVSGQINLRVIYHKRKFSPIALEWVMKHWSLSQTTDVLTLYT